jgi:RND family efflux transporter MFP subunit
MNLPQFKLKPTALLVAGAIALITLAMVMASNKSTAAADPKAAPAKAALTVTTALPQAVSLPIKLSANGNVVAWQEAIIGSELNGLRLAEVHANVGDSVKAGQVLAVFATEAVAADLAQAHAAMMEAQASAAEAHANAVRATSLQSSGALSAQQYTQFMTAEQTANARAAAAKATLATQQLRMKYTQVVAPDSGIISARTAAVGSVVGAGTELFRLIRQGRLEWRAEVTAAELGRIKTGAAAVVKAANGSELTGRVRMIGPTVDPQSRAALVYVDLPPTTNGNAPFKAGMFASGSFDMGVSDALTVPQQSVAVRDGFSYVFKLGKDQRVQQQKVQTGRRLQDRIEVLDGIAAATPVVVAGAGFLNDGDLVRTAAATTAAAAAPAGAAKARAK